MVLIYRNKDINKDIFDLINYHYCVIIAIDSYNILKFYPHECNWKRGYFITTTGGASIETIKQYIEKQQRR